MLSARVHVLSGRCSTKSVLLTRVAAANGAWRRSTVSQRARYTPGLEESLHARIGTVAQCGHPITKVRRHVLVTVRPIEEEHPHRGVGDERAGIVGEGPDRPHHVAQPGSFDVGQKFE